MVAKRSYPTSEVGQRPRLPDCNGTGTAERSCPASEVGGGGGGRRAEIPSARGQGRLREELPESEVRGGSREEIPHALKPEASGGGGKTNSAPKALARAQEGLEELSHVEGQEGRR